MQTIQSLELSLLRLYIVNAIKTGHREKALEFFKSFISALFFISSCISVGIAAVVCIEYATLVDCLDPTHLCTPTS